MFWEIKFWCVLTLCVQLINVCSVTGSAQDKRTVKQVPRIDKMPPCVHDEIAEINPHIVDLSSQNKGAEKRQAPLSYSNIRIQPVFANVSSTADPFLRGVDSPLSHAIKILESVLMVHPVQGNLRIPPMCSEYTYGVNEGKCRSPLPSQSNYDCGDFGTIPLSYIGVREVCTTSYLSSSCTLQGPNGVGLPNADYLLFVSASSTTSSCVRGSLAHALHCVLDSSDNNRPVAGRINICPSFFEDYGGQTSVVLGLLMHEIIHVLGFSRHLFDRFVTENGTSYNPRTVITGPYGSTSIFTGPKTIEVAKAYYSCDDIEGILLENEGGSGTLSSHWDKRTLHHEVMNGFISNDYSVLSEFTIALLEDSGWYKGNYTALSALNQHPLEWGKGLGCAFLTEQCTNHSVYPYLCNPNPSEMMCTYDHLSKGTCSTRWSGFDDCPVAIADEPEHYCRTELEIPVQRDIESYTNNSICIDGRTSLSSHSCGTYITETDIPLCVVQESYVVNGSNSYAVYLNGRPFRCKDDVALVTADNWVVPCPPTEDVLSRSTAILPETPVLLPVNETRFDDAYRNVLPSNNQELVTFGGLMLDGSFNFNVVLQVNSFYNATVPLCHLYGCRTCTVPDMVYSNATMLFDADKVYLANSRLLVAISVFSNTRIQSTDVSLVLMLDPHATYSFVHYAISIDFVSDHLRTLHSNDHSIFIISALSNNTEVRIAPSRDVIINGFIENYGEECILILHIGESMMVTSSEDLTGSRVTANKAISFYSGHYCATGSTDNCSVLIEQIPPFNSWGNSFILHTNVSGLIGNMFKLMSSDIGASVSINCTTDGINYESNNYHLGFRQHLVLSITHHHCIVDGDERILVVQFSNGSQIPSDTFMTILQTPEQFEHHYVFNMYNNFSNYVALTVKASNPSFNHILLNNSAVGVTWERISLNGNIYYFGVITLSAGKHILEANFKFGAILYGSNTDYTYALPAGMILNITAKPPSQAPLPVQDAVLTLVDGMINVTWTPPVVPNGIICQYIVQRVNSSGKFYHYVPANQNTISLPYINDGLVFVAAVNLYGQSDFVHAKSPVPCQPSPCINHGICNVVNGSSFNCTCSDPFFGLFCEKISKLYPYGYTNNDTSLSSYSFRSSTSVNLSHNFIFYGHRYRKVYVNSNGVVSLSSRLSNFYSTPRLPLSDNQKIIAPYWSEVDTRGTGQVFYRQTTDPNLLARATSEIRAAFPMSKNVTIVDLFIATWDSVGYYYRNTDKTNTFQCILATSGVESFVMFIYPDGGIQWTTTSYYYYRSNALAGINAGDGRNFIIVPGSRTPDIINVAVTSNVGDRGVWMFRVDEEMCDADAYTCISEFYPFGFLENDTTLLSLDGEGSSPPIALSEDLHFYNNVVRTAYVFDNGMISFDNNYTAHTPRPFPLNDTNMIVAPFWADVDTRGIGQVFYRQTTDPNLLARATSEIREFFPDSQNVTMQNLLIATWDNVGYYNFRTNKANTFQCVIAHGGNESFAIFLYADGRMHWTTGDRSGGYNGLGGTEALAGINAGDGFNSYTIPRSLTSSIIYIDGTSNVGIPGVWMFRISKEKDYCQPEISTCLSEFYPFGVLENDTTFPQLSYYYQSRRSPPIVLTETVFIYDQPTRIVYINENGVLSFDSHYYVQTPLQFPLRGDEKIIAPFWAAVDIRGSGQVFYRQSVEPSLLSRANSEIRSAFPMYQNVTVWSILIATWYKVGYYYQNFQKTNTFQSVLATTNVGSFAMFLYADGRIQWTTGDISGGDDGLGGTEALAGINAGDGFNFVTIPGSRTSEIINVTKTSNIGITGVWMFHLQSVDYCDSGDCTCVSEFYPFGYTHGDAALSGYYHSSGRINLLENYYFQNEIIRTAYVIENGIISLSGDYYSSTPQPFPLSGTDKIIAPYWADVDTTEVGQVFYRQTTDPSLLERATREIWSAYPNAQNTTITSLLIVTWSRVGYRNYQEDTDYKTNTFQCVLATSGVESFVIFLYADGEMQWTTGDSSGGDDGLGGTEALAGINAGDGTTSVTIPGSLTPSIINITQTSNVGIPGVWMFKVGNGIDHCQPELRTCLSEFFPFGYSHNDTTLQSYYFGSYLITLLDDFYFYNERVTSLYINENGVISFGSIYNVRTPLSLPLNGTDKIIAPYWADVDIRGTGRVFYRQTTDPSLLAKATSAIRAAFHVSQDLMIKSLLIATWDHVGYYYAQSDKTNTFQCVLATSGVESFVIFLYADGRIQWTTGDRSGGYRGLNGTEALAGINAGDGVNSITIPGSLTPIILNITQTSNIGIPGVWMFKVGRDNCQPSIATCSSEFYPFGYTHNDATLPYYYYGTSSGLVTLTGDFFFYNSTIRSVYINENGVISIESRYTTSTPRSFPLSGTIKLIAPYWADADTRGSGQVFYRQTTDPSLLVRATREIRTALHLSQNVTITNLLIATWRDVDHYYYRNSNKTNTFQCVLATSGVESFVIFLYADGRMQWTTGDVSGGVNGFGGTEALAGINVGDGVNSITIPGSLTPSIINVTYTSNVGIPGVWMYKVGEGKSCEQESRTCVSEFYPFGYSHNDNSFSSYSSYRYYSFDYFYFSNETFRSVYINENGVISFGSRYSSSTPRSFPLSGTYKIIAPYWANVDLSGTGRVFYRQTTDPSLLARATSEIRAALLMSHDISIKRLLIATWEDVGYYNRKTDKTNTFQCVLATSEVESFVIFLYADGKIQWTTGDNSGGFRGLGGTEALAGINYGDGVSFVTIPGSLTPSIINITQTSNVGISGMWMFKVGEETCQQESSTCLLELYPFGLSHNDTILPTANTYTDEEISSRITLSEYFFFYDETFRSVYVNDNGVLSFDGQFTPYTPQSLPLRGTDKIIAPYWADVDTRGTGDIFYRQTTDPSLLARATSEIRGAFSFHQDETIQNLLIVTWSKVSHYLNTGYYQSTYKTSTFQCVLASSGFESFVMFLYPDERIQWTTGDRSGGVSGLNGTEALAGINAGDGVNSVTIPGSLTPSIINVTQTSNVDIPGVWMFKVGEDLCQPELSTCLLELYPYGLAHNDVALPHLSFGEGSSPMIFLLEDFIFYGEAVRTAYVIQGSASYFHIGGQINDNGVISFSKRYNVHTPLPLPLSGTDKIIAPYWADVDTRAFGNIYYRQTTDPSLLARATNEIRAAYPSSHTVTITRLLIATWDHVGYYYQSSEKTNTFQCVLATNGVESFVMFLYADGRMQWTTGDLSGGDDGVGGTEALAGINAGDGINFVTIPGSRTSNIVNIAKTSNVGIPGIWIFKPTQETDTCQPEINTCASEFYPYGVVQNDTTLPMSICGKGSSSEIHLSESFTLYGEIFSTVYGIKQAVIVGLNSAKQPVIVNDHGIISFNESYNVRTPRSFPLIGSPLIIAPYWADVDNRGTGQVFYRQTTDPSLLARATSEISTAFSILPGITMQNLLIVTWSGVGYYNQNTEKTNTFQCVLATSGVESFVIFLYADGRMQWTTGDDSGGSSGLYGTEALAGINAGDGVNFTVIPESLTPSIINITRTSNVGIPGMWMFRTGNVQEILTTNFTVVSTMATTITFSWDVLNEQRRFNVRWYIIKCSDGNSNIHQAAITGNTTVGAITGLSPYTTYDCTVNAVTSINGALSDPITVTTSQQRSNPPAILSLTTIDSHSVQVIWRTPTQPNGVLISYTVTYKLDSSVSSISITIPYNGEMTQSYSITELAPHQLVIVTITATNGAGTSNSSSAAQIRTGESVPGVVEFDVSRSSLSNEMLITWNEPAQPNGVILAYQVIYSIYNNGTTSVSNILSNSTREYVITHLKPGVPYQVTVVSFTSTGRGELGDYVTFFTRELPPTNLPDNIQAHRINPTSINVTWTPLSLNEAHGFPYYMVVLTSVNANSHQSIPAPVTTSSSFVVFSDLDENAEYYIEVHVTNSQFNSYINSDRIKVSRFSNDAGDDVDDIVHDTVSISRLHAAIIVGVVLLLLSLACITIVACCCCRCRKKLSSRRKRNDHREDFALNQNFLLQRRAVNKRNVLVNQPSFLVQNQAFENEAFEDDDKRLDAIY